jgi:hypothetical protein
MIPQTQTILQSYFVTGAEPTQAQFTELIGTMFYLYQSAVNSAAAAAATAAALAGSSPLAAVRCTIINTTLNNPGAVTISKQANIASVQLYNTGGTDVYGVPVIALQINFAAALPDANYQSLGCYLNPANGFTPSFNTGGGAVLTGLSVQSQTVAQLELRPSFGDRIHTGLTDPVAGMVGASLDLVIF